MYIGATTVQTEPLWLCPAKLPTAKGALPRLVWREARYIPGLYKIFDEILVNALDNRQRDPVNMDEISVDIEPKTGKTTIRNTGRGIPVRRHETEDVWIPEMIMGSLFSGSNFDDTQKKTVGGRHGFGAKLTNLFSTEFSVQTLDSSEGLMYTQHWSDNMSVRSEPVIEAVDASRSDFTTVSFTPDLARFGVKELHSDMLGIFRRRVYEAAATAYPARVLLDGRQLHLQGLPDLAAMHTSGQRLKAKQFAFVEASARWRVGACVSPIGSFCPVAYVNGVATPRGGTHVNHVASQLLAELCPALSKALKLSPEAAEALTPARLRPHLMLFVDCSIDNPEFDSQSKEALTTPPAKFGGLCRLPDSFVRSVAAMDGLRELVREATARRDERMLAKRTRQLGGESSVNLDVPKLEDAELAGGPRSSECTLIVTEGDSAKALAVAGLAVVGRQSYGVFPLRGKPLNVRDVSARRVGDNEELTGLMKALGLAPGVSYAGSDVLRARALKDGFEPLAAAEAEIVGDAREIVGDARGTTRRGGKAKKTAAAAAKGKARGGGDSANGNGLRYGRLMLMADQDSDGSHIKGLVISMLHHYWPELLAAGFVQEFQTPLLKARKLSDGNSVAFYTLRSYAQWRQSLDPREQKQWRAKYYKGLGTSTAQEAREYFAALESHRVQLEMEDTEKEGDLIDMAFSKKRAAERKDWMREATRREQLEAARAADVEGAKGAAAAAAAAADETGGTGARRRKKRPKGAAAEAARAAAMLDAPVTRRSYANFVDDDLVQFSLADLRRSLPSAIDGLKPSQRKVLYGCFAKGLLPSAAEIKVAQLAGFCTEATAYHHGEASMHSTIVNMAQDFVGSNNVPLLEPCGQFGTRAEGGKDAASARYIFTRLAPLTPLLFPPADLPTLRYQVEDGQGVEPVHYVPVLPMLLLNGSSGIGTGWSTACQAYHPLAVLDNVLRHAEGEPMLPMTPWVAGFKGKIEVEYSRRRGGGGGATVAAADGWTEEEDGDDVEGAASSCSSPGGESFAKRFITRGIAELGERGLVISELPLGRWTSGYKDWIQKMMSEGSAYWTSFTERHTERSVCFELHSTPEQLNLLREDVAERGGGANGLLEVLQLTSKHSLTNTHAFDAEGELRHFDSPLEVIELHAEQRISAYAARKAHCLALLADELALLEARSRFIRMAVGGELPLLFERAPRQAVCDALALAGFLPHLTPTAPALLLLPGDAAPSAEARDASMGDGGREDGSEDGSEKDGDETGAMVRSASGGSGSSSSASAFDYLLRMPLLSLTEERMASLERQVAKKRDEFDELHATSELDLWRRDLEALRPALEEYVRGWEMMEGSSDQTPPAKGGAGIKSRKKRQP